VARSETEFELEHIEESVSDQVSCERTTFLENDGVLHITMRACRSTGWVLQRAAAILFYLLVCVLALMGLVDHFRVASTTERLVLVFVGTAPCALTLLVVVNTVHQLFGCEVLTVGRGVLRIETLLFGIRRKRTFQLKGVERFRLEERIYRHKSGQHVYRRVAFDYDGKKVRNQMNLSRAEGERLFNAIEPFVQSPLPLAATIANEPPGRLPTC
jgi:hypothetical protein